MDTFDFDLRKLFLHIFKQYEQECGYAEYWHGYDLGAHNHSCVTIQYNYTLDCVILSLNKNYINEKLILSVPNFGQFG